MSYSNNVFAITRVEKFLRQMSEASTSLEWESEEPYKLAYYIREGIHVANQREHPYGKLAGKFIIRSKKNKVIAQLRVLSPEYSELKRTLNKMVLPGLKKLLEVVGASIQHKAEEMYFPDAELDDEAIERLYKWTCENQYYIVLGEGLTLTVLDPGESKWSPKTK